MKIRTQLIVAFVLLAVVPLSGIVLYSYLSSERAVRQAVASEAATLTREMEERMASIEGDLNRRVERVGALPVWRRLARDQSDSPQDREDAVDLVLSELGEVAPLLRSLEFVSAAPEAGEPAAEAPPMPPPPSRWVIDFSAVLAEVEDELQAELPSSVRARVVEGLRAGAEKMRDVGAKFAEDWQVQMEEAWSQAETARQLAAEQTPGDPQLGSPAPAAPAPPPAAPSPLAAEELEARRRELDRHRDALRRLHERRFEVPVLEGDAVVGSFRAEISVAEVLERVLGRTRRDQGEIPFAIDLEGNLITLEDGDRAQLAALPIEQMASGEPPPRLPANWVVVTRQEPVSGLTFGLARPIRESLEEVRLTAARNFGYGLALIGVALIGILPLSRRMTRGLGAVTAGAERVARGDLKARVPVTGSSEIGQLANAFNRMAFDLEQHQQKLVEEERRRRDQEVRQQLLEAEVQRKTDELEEARRFQLSLLPRELPRHPAFEVAVAMRTATEVGGDYYDFRETSGGALIAAVGDATGHGARAGTMVTVIKSLFSAYPPKRRLADFLAEANAAVRKMELGRMAMALCLARLEGRRLTFASAGMPPALLRRGGDGRVEELAASGMPLGGLAGDYLESVAELEPGDTLLLMSDGLPELPNAAGEPLGYDGVARIVGEAPCDTPDQLIEALLAAARDWAGEGPPADDITFVALRAI